MGHGCKTVHRMCPPPRSLALEANGCFMVWVQPAPTEYKVAARGFARHGGLPSARSCSTLNPAESQKQNAGLDRSALCSRPPPPLRAAFGRC